MDEMILRMLRNPQDLSDALGPPWFERSMVNLSAVGSTIALTLMILSAIGLLLIQKRYASVILLAVSYGGALLLNSGLKWLFGRERPSVVPHLDYVSNASFPSGHTLLATAVYCTLGAIAANSTPNHAAKKYIMSLAVFFSLCIGLTRVYLGVHYPSDVLAGWGIALIWTVLCCKGARRYSNSL